MSFEHGVEDVRPVICAGEEHPDISYPTRCVVLLPGAGDELEMGLEAAEEEQPLDLRLPPNQREPSILLAQSLIGPDDDLEPARIHESQSAQVKDDDGHL